ncbi:MAG: methyltransferase domain-containing protein [Methanomicrobiaceae archaeon]|uniref:Trna-(G10-n2) methyltransferase n=1 Tax=hydrocarbon metagenome TaxID=938273 RepID=A0A0W8FII4_9ZZZZ|nr:methyltransferase domain-containing protein [Methanomicrobiaceae archaeon]MDD5418559.1 methyltransferase domain-containing protein [Methanomicrobiaceae archaeon]
MKLIFELSGEHSELPVAELECVGRVIDRRRQVAVAECPEPYATERLALTHAVLEYIGECEASTEALYDLLQRLSLRTESTFAARAKKMHGTLLRASQLELERLIGGMIEGPVSLKHPQEEYRAIISEDRCYFGRLLLRIDRGAFEYRNPMRRPFFHPGVMMPRMARALVNLTLVQRGETLYDPFCGTGGILLEAETIGVEVLGSDFDPAMVEGSRRNLPGARIMLADATRLPLSDASVDAVATDLPYGQSVRIRADSIDRLYSGALAEIRRVLKPGRRAVIVTHRDINEIARGHFSILQLHRQRVHKSLTRRILVLK